jgi:hypothetical protein
MLTTAENVPAGAQSQQRSGGGKKNLGTADIRRHIKLNQQTV